MRIHKAPPKKTSCQVGVILRLPNLIPTSAKLHIVKFAILPHLKHCQSVWDFCRSSDARKLERIQERALRAVYCDNKSTYEELLQKANLPTLYTRRLQDIATIMYKNNLAPPYIADLFMVNNSQYSLRNSEFLLPRFQTVAYGKHSYLQVLLFGQNLTPLSDLLNLSILVRPVLNLCIDLSNLMDNT